MNQGWIYRDQVGPADAGLSLLEYYAERYRHSSRRDWRARIEAGQILVDRQRVTPETLLQAGQQLTYARPPWEEPVVPLDFEVLHEDKDLLVVAKPSGLPVLPGGGFLEHTLLRQLQRCYPSETPVPIHRLGRGTSGLMLLARSHLARSHLSHQMRQSTAQAESPTDSTAAPGKLYLALIAPCDLPDCFTLTTPIGKVAHPVLGHVYAATPTGKPAYSTVRVLQRREESTLLEVAIRTGRPHQIRIHLAAAGYPLLGDPLYAPGGVPQVLAPDADGKLPVPGDCGYWLHAFRLRFIHPRHQEVMEFECSPPDALSLQR
ncbi:MAG TPA: RluA family pseudouridine synthase [Trichocoleus sp.]